MLGGVGYYIALDENEFFYFRTVHIVIFILFKPTHVFFLKHTYIHI
jgi:hypothetical protein